MKFNNIDMAVEKEGYMVLGFQIGDESTPIAKVKTPYYLTKKAVSRMGVKTANLMFDNTEEFKKRIDEEFYGVVDFIVNTYDKDVWLSIDQEQRKLIFNRYFMEVL